MRWLQSAPAEQFALLQSARAAGVPIRDTEEGDPLVPELSLERLLSSGGRPLVALFTERCTRSDDDVFSLDMSHCTRELHKTRNGAAEVTPAEAERAAEYRARMLDGFLHALIGLARGAGPGAQRAAAPADPVSLTVPNLGPQELQPSRLNADAPVASGQARMGDVRAAPPAPSSASGFAMPSAELVVEATARAEPSAKRAPERRPFGWNPPPPHLDGVPDILQLQ